jgi:hypothetical protein
MSQLALFGTVSHLLPYPAGSAGAGCVDELTGFDTSRSD